MFVELHIIQNFSPSNLNRDATNNPKDCEFGGVRRARISSQCIKRAIRRHPVFAQTTAVENGTRTRWMTRLLFESLVTGGKTEQDAQPVAEAFASQYSNLDKKGNTSVLLYLSPGEIETISEHILENWEDILVGIESEDQRSLKGLVKEIVKQTRDRTGAPDIALFGRMLAQKPELNLDAACQVAHAISTHRIAMEMDFFTAVDDLLTSDEPGAGMIGVIGYNSACFYRYARLDWEQLKNNLDGDMDLARRSVEGFLRASVLAVPTGKQTSFAAQNPPSFLLAVVRGDGMSWSLANAFEKPIYPGKDGLVSTSVIALDHYWGSVTKAYGQNNIHPVSLSVEQIALPNLQSTLRKDLDDWLGEVISALPKE